MRLQRMRYAAGQLKGQLHPPLSWLLARLRVVSEVLTRPAGSVPLNSLSCRSSFCSADKPPANST
jgi:hypothetical protein